MADVVYDDFEKSQVWFQVRLKTVVDCEEQIVIEVKRLNALHLAVFSGYGGRFLPSRRIKQSLREFLNVISDCSASRPFHIISGSLSSSYIRDY